MTDEAQKIVDELAGHIRGWSTVEGNDKHRHLSGALQARILAAASKPKHPTPDQFITAQTPIIKSVVMDTGGSRFYVEHGGAIDVIKRQLDTSVRAIALLRTCVPRHSASCREHGEAAIAFLAALDEGLDFPEVQDE